MSNKFTVPKELEDKSNLIGGVWSNANSGNTFEVRSPVSGEILAKVPKCDSTDVDKAVEAARRTRDKFKSMPVFKRAELLRRCERLVLDRKETIAKVLTMEQGKPYFKEAIPEVEETAENLRLLAEDVIRLESPLFPVADPNKRGITIREGIGVQAIITPWNFPTVIPSEYIGPALAAGNPVIMKPASTTPLSAILMVHCIQDALDELDFPKGVFSLITGPGSSVGSYLVAHPNVDLIGFTGETVTGEAISNKAGLKRTILELGGNGPQIVCADANLKEAARAAAYGCFYNAGQVCVATERILVERSVHDEFLNLFMEEVANWKPGDPLKEGASMGPLNNEPTAAKVETHLKDALKKGATILCGGKRESGWPTDLYFPPTVIDGVTRDMLLNTDETFGPVAPIIVFDNDEEAVEIANETGYGLQMAVFSSSIRKLFYYAEKLRSGNIVFNDTTCWWETTNPFGGGGGTKSGHGTLGGHWAIEDATYLKTIVVDINKTK
jgi:acyl-CoA reductase-like NAD-dependent aldehyde dehydrogenase